MTIARSIRAARGSRLAIALIVLPAPAFAGTAEPPPAEPAAICLADGQVEDVLVHAGSVYLAGRFEKVRPPGEVIGGPGEVARRWFAACDLATGAVLPWNPGADCLAPASCVNVRGQTLALAADGASLYLGGKFSHVGGAARRNAARVTIPGAALLPWNPAPNDRVQRIAVAPDGARVYLAGSFSAAGGCAPAPCHARLAATDPASGAAVAGFDPAVAADGGGFSTVHALAFSGDGATIFFGGQFDVVNGVARDSAAAIDAATGTQTTAFAPRLSDDNPADPEVQVYDLHVAGGWVYLCGDWWATADLGGEHDQRNVNRFDPADGNHDPDFWIATDGGVQACALDERTGMLFVGGHFDCVREWLDATTPADPGAQQCGADPLFVGTWQRDLFALALADGALVDWNPDTSGGPGIWAAAAATDWLVVGGEVGWPRQGTATHQNLLRFDLRPFADDFETGDLRRWSASVP